MKAFNYALLLLAVSLMTLACVQPPDYPNEPEITYSGVNKNTIDQGNGNAISDTLIVFFEFTDGDGDLSSQNDSLDIFLTDSRDNFITPFKIPFISEQGSGNGISGEITLRIPNKPFQICCTYPDSSTPCVPNPQFPIDTFSYAIRIRDQAGNFSNFVQTETITIRCN